jgi:hypothetical protein
VETRGGWAFPRATAASYPTLITLPPGSCWRSTSASLSNQSTPHRSLLIGRMEFDRQLCCTIPAVGFVFPRAYSPEGLFTRPSPGVPPISGLLAAHARVGWRCVQGQRGAGKQRGAALGLCRDRRAGSRLRPPPQLPPGGGSGCLLSFSAELLRLGPRGSPGSRTVRAQLS